MSQPKWSFRVKLPSRRPLPSPRPLLLSSQMWSCWRWTAPRPAAGSTTNCGLTRSSGRRTTAPSASAWTQSRTARPWPASRAARTRSRSPENAALSAKVRRARGGWGGRCAPEPERTPVPHIRGSGVPLVLPQRPCQHGLIKGRPQSILGAAGSFVRLYYCCPPK